MVSMTNWAGAPAVVASEKGVVVGRLRFREDGDQIDCQRMGVGGKAIPPNIDKVQGCFAVYALCLDQNFRAAYMPSRATGLHACGRHANAMHN